jgi:hypothetical protein
MRFTQKKKTNGLGLRLKNTKRKEEIVLKKKAASMCLFSPKTKGQPEWYKRVV